MSIKKGERNGKQRGHTELQRRRRRRRRRPSNTRDLREGSLSLGRLRSPYDFSAGPLWTKPLPE